MAVALLIKFDEDQDAKDFIEAAENDDVFISVVAGQADLTRIHSDYEVISAYKFPTQYHEPFESHGQGKTGGSAWTLGQKWGWWVCNVCKKPSRLYWETIMKQSSFGKNILDLLKPKKDTDA